MLTSRFCMLGAAWLCAALCGIPEATAQIVWPQPILTQVITGVSDPVHVTHAGDGSGRLFIVERAGLIRIYQNGDLLSTPFLDITSKTSIGGERGLLSVAFPPGYETSGRFYVFYTQESGGDLVIARYYVTANPNVASASSEEILLIIDHSSASNHNGGQLAFSPTDGYLYISTGDGGNTPAEAQNLSGLLGKLLRIDVNSGTPYAIPPDNPFLTTSGARPEIWARGLRNPWRFSFDPANGDLYLADVGQNSWEEVDVQRDTSTGGENYGWNIMEGLHCYQSGCSPTGLTLPVLEYSSTGSDCAIMGGVVYRGTPYPRMQGVYFYADYCTGKIWGLQHNGSAWQSSLLTTFNQQFALTSFGEGEDGSIYFTDSPNGAIYRITDNVPTTADLRVTLAASPSPATVGQPFSLTATVTNLGGATATGVNLTETLATGPTIGSITPSQGSCSRVNQAVTCVLGTLNNGASATVAIVVTPTVAGTLINQATVTAVESDPQTGNNTQQTPTTVNPLTPPPPSGSDLSVTQLGTPNPIVAGNALTVTVVVGNSGPDPATGVVLTDELPAGATLVSATTTSGVCNGTGPVSCAIGGLAVGADVTATIVVTAGAAGTATNTVRVSADQIDPSPANNAATFDITVVEPSGELTLASGPQLPSTGFDADAGSADVPMLQFSFTTGAEAVTLDSVTLAASGSGNDATDVLAIRVVLDANGNGVVDQDEATLGSGSFGADNSVITVAFTPPHTIPGSTSETYLVVYDFALVRGATQPVTAGLIVLALAGFLGASRSRQSIVLVIAVAGLCGVAACSNGGESSDSPPVLATTYQLSLTGVTAREESSGGPVAISGLPLDGPVVTVR